MTTMNRKRDWVIDGLLDHPLCYVSIEDSGGSQGLTMAINHHTMAKLAGAGKVLG